MLVGGSHARNIILVTQVDETTAIQPPLSTSTPASHFTGEVVYLYAFDLAYEMSRTPIARLLDEPVAEFVIGSSKRSPRQLLFYRPRTVRLPSLERLGPLGPVRLERIVKLLPVGAVSVTVRMPFKVKSLDELVAFHDVRFADGIWLYDEVRSLVEDLRKELAPFLIKPVEHLGDEEAYTVFCMNGPLITADGKEMPAEQWLASHRREVAALLTEEPDPSRLSEQEVTESTGRNLSYYNRDLVVIDWDAALLVDEPRFFDESLYVMELANVQLAELEAYDRLLDAVVDRSYRDISARPPHLRQNVRIERELREFRIDLARLSDELSNITKFFGDWHLARLYQALSDRFHLADWHRSIDEKLKTLDDLYQLLRAEQNNRWLLMLEASMALLFIIDVIILVIGFRH